LSVMRGDTMKKYVPLILLILFTAGLAFAAHPQLKHGGMTLSCSHCHDGHGVPATPLLPAAEEKACYVCHGSAATLKAAQKRDTVGAAMRRTNIEDVFSKPYRHPVDLVSGYSDPSGLPETDPRAQRRAECRDCHNSHYVVSKGQVARRPGVTARSVKVDQASSEYEICYQCHSVSANLPSDQADKSRQFDARNPSYHPIEGVGKNSDVPSLIRPWNVGSIMRCTDCHNNDDSGGPVGPHGSRYEHILKFNFSDRDGLSESSFQYELCYSCHRRSSVLGDESFPLHYSHVSEIRTSCATCHNSHGSENERYLIDFSNADKSFTVRPSSSGRLEFNTLGKNKGECYLNCHNKDHNPLKY
jgi:predicted CXXCH cytochrome family protein